jgi:xanthine dehydrogenase accessory factor
MTATSGQRPFDPLRLIATRTEQAGPFAVVTLLDTEGSTPAKIGSKAIVDSLGRITGTIGGGALEGFAQRTAVGALRSGDPAVFDFSLQGVGPPVPDPICGGKLRVLIDPAATRHQQAYCLALSAREERRRGLLLTSVRSRRESGFEQENAKVSVQWLEESALASHSGFPDRGTLEKVLRRETSEFCVQLDMQKGEQLEVLVEPIVPKPRLLIVGGGHVGQALAHQAGLVGFDLAVIDDREEFTSPALFPEGADMRCGNIPETIAAFPFTDDTYVALVTRGHKCDAEALEVCLRKPRAYLGMIGSKRKVVLVKKSFLESGRATPEEWEKIYTPIGLDIGALTVPEIATSIVAQLIAVRRKGSASGMPTQTPEG